MTTPESPSGSFTTCTGCGRVIPSHRMLCDRCRDEREVVGMAEVVEADATAPAPVGPVRAHRFKPAGTLAIALRVLFSALVLLEGVALGLLLVLEHMAGRLVQNPLAYTLADFRSQRQLAVTLGWVEIGFFFVIASLFMAWMFRSAGNVPALVASRPRYGRGWSIGGWFVPFANFVIPKQITDDLWRSSEPGAESGSYFAWGSGDVHRNVHLWWAAFLLSRLLFVIGNNAIGSPNPASIRNGARFAIAATLLTLAGAALATWVTGTISRRQLTRALDLGRNVADRDATRWFPATAAAVGVAAAALVFAGYQFFDVGESAQVFGGPSDESAGRYEDFGIAFEYDPGYFGAAAGLDGTGEPGEDGGIVVIGRLGAFESGFVMWGPADTAGFAGISAVDQVINGASQAYGTGALVTRSDPIDLDHGPVPFVARTFHVNGDLIGQGAVAAGGCADADRMVMLMWARDNSIEYGEAPEDLEVMQELIAILSTLDC